MYGNNIFEAESEIFKGREWAPTKWRMNFHEIFKDPQERIKGRMYTRDYRDNVWK